MITAKRLRKIRDAHGLSQAELGRLIGRDGSTVSRLEGRSDVLPEYVEVLLVGAGLINRAKER